MMGSLCTALLLLSAFHLFIALAETKFGCLFEDDLCKSYEICLNDAVFGRCQRVPAIDVFKYEVSPSVVQRLRTILQKLSHRGFTWKDDYTQRIIASELSNIRKIHSRQPERLASDGSSTPRVSKLNPENDRNYEPEKNKNFAKSFNQYLQYIGILPQSATPSFYPRTKTEKPPVMNDHIKSDRLIDYMFQKSQGKTPARPFAAVSHQIVPENLPSKTLNQPLPEKLPKESATDTQKKSLLAALQAYLAQKVVAHNSDNLSPIGRSKVASNRYLTPQLSQTDGVLPEDKEGDGFNMKPFLQRPRARVLSRPSVGALIYKSSSRHEDPKDPLNAVDETFIQNVVKELGKHKLNIDNLNPKELDELADVIADTLQIVDGGDQVSTRKQEAERAEQELKELYVSQEDGDQDIEVNNTLQGHETNGKDSQFEMKVKGIGTKQGNLLNENTFTVNPISQEFMPEEPLNIELKKYEDFHYTSDEEGDKKVGIENVKSETFTRDITAQKKDAQNIDSKEVVELQHWMQESLAQEERSYHEKPKKMLIDDLQLQVKSSSSDRYGYIVTQKNPLTVEKGLELLKKVAMLRKQQMDAFSDVSVLGSAVMFQVRTDVHNLTTEDVANVAAANKDQLEKSTGLQILQTGVAEKSKLKFLPHHLEEEESTKFIILTLISIVCLIGVLTASGVIYCLRHRSHHKLREKLSSLGSDTNTDATTAYQSYMEDHLKNKNRLEKEWEALCAYQAEPNTANIAQKGDNLLKNRSLAVITYDHNRIILKAENSHDNSDYINASPIMDHDPRNPAYISTQGPLPTTVADFWQMVWENGCVVIVMLTSLAENGVKQCYHYWPDEGSDRYHIYEVNLVSEHIWCEDFLVRSFYLKNLQTNETRTVTQFNFLNWNDQGVPSSTRSLLDFRRKVNKCYKGRSCPVIVHCSDGAGRSGTYILIDMVLNKMAKGAKEIDIAATLEHLRDQRPGMVQTKEQFEFALTAVAEEVNAVLKALSQ
ncbi:receptor-type tyrosine-protein phosphatase N2 isoform X2 [Ascaphus truei]|uniref:receptor-type tyrosine-protein phosphatase N2 isoform X2 n=1 Tax=Ascaphus truei TaxID=8439 RepID=UPI003F5AA0A4